MFFKKACFLLALTINSYASLNPNDVRVTCKGNGFNVFVPERCVCNLKTGDLKLKHCCGGNHLSVKGLKSKEKSHSSRNKSKSKLSSVRSLCSINPSGQRLNTEGDIKTTRKIRDSEYYDQIVRENERLKEKNKNLEQRNRVLSINSLKEQKSISQKNSSLLEKIEDLETEHLKTETEYGCELSAKNQELEDLRSAYEKMKNEAQYCFFVGQTNNNLLHL
jgi:hypothetical protein